LTTSGRGTNGVAWTIGGATIAPGERRTVDLPISVLSDHTPATLSVHVVHGRRSGPTAFISAGIHGDEVVGAEIIRRVLRHPGLGRLAGTLLVVPIVNTYGFLSHSRYLPDRRDLNRSFPGSSEGSLAARLANRFMEEVVARSAFGIDLHSAAVHRTNLPQLRVSPGDTGALRIARAFGAPVILDAPVRDGSLRSAAQARGVDVVVYEAGEGLRFDERSVRAGVSGILRVLRDQRMMPARGVAKPRRESLECSTSRWLRAPQGGLLRTYRSEGDVVREGDLLAAVSDPFGQAETNVIAEFDGIIVGRTLLPIVNEGDALFHVARLSETKRASSTVEALTNQLAQDPLFDEDEII